MLIGGLSNTLGEGCPKIANIKICRCFYFQSADTLQIKGLASASTAAENSPDKNSMIENRSTALLDGTPENENDLNRSENIWAREQISHSSLKRAASGTAQMNSPSNASSNYSPSLLSYTAPKRSKTNKRAKSISPVNESANTISTNHLQNNNKGHSSDTTNSPHVISSAELQQTSHSSLSGFPGLTASTLGIKEESANVQLDVADGVGAVANSTTSYLPQSEHVVIPTDPNLIQGISVFI